MSPYWAAPMRRKYVIKITNLKLAPKTSPNTFSKQVLLTIPIFCISITSKQRFKIWLPISEWNIHIEIHSRKHLEIPFSSTAKLGENSSH